MGDRTLPPPLNFFLDSFHILYWHDAVGGKSVDIRPISLMVAEELKARIREIIEAKCPERVDLGEMYVGTIHSFCFEMLKDLDTVTVASMFWMNLRESPSSPCLTDTICLARAAR